MIKTFTSFILFCVGLELDSLLKFFSFTIFLSKYTFSLGTFLSFVQNSISLLCYDMFKLLLVIYLSWIQYYLPNLRWWWREAAKGSLDAPFPWVNRENGTIVQVLSWLEGQTSLLFTTYYIILIDVTYSLPYRDIELNLM